MRVRNKILDALTLQLLRRLHKTPSQNFSLISPTLFPNNSILASSPLSSNLILQIYIQVILSLQVFTHIYLHKYVCVCIYRQIDRLLRILWRRLWGPNPVFLLEESHGQRNLASYSPWGHKELDTTEATGTHTCIYIHTHTHIYIFSVSQPLCFSQ